MSPPGFDFNEMQDIIKGSNDIYFFSAIFPVAGQDGVAFFCKPLGGELFTTLASIKVNPHGLMFCSTFDQHMKNQNKVFVLEGKVQHYQWGGFTYLPELLGIDNQKGEPFAEYWLGAHSQAASIIRGDGSLAELIANDPSVLGEKVKNTFGRLPYLLKILDVKDMLSIQVHPTKEMAVKGFAAENSAGLAATASNRNYKDDNHKPELMVALGDFWLLHGFRPVQSMHKILDTIPELQFLLEVFGDGDYKALYKEVMEMPQEEVNRRLGPLLERILQVYEKGKLQKSAPDFWASRAALTFKNGENIDRGIFSVYLLNLVFLKKGEAIFQDAGILHAYLEGQNVEIMANSDNVLRGGLTPKHIDVPELLKHVSFHAVEPKVIVGTTLNGFEKKFFSPAADFELSQLHIAKDSSKSLHTPTTDILIVLEGKLVAEEENAGSQTPIIVDKGGSLLLMAGARIRLESPTGAVLYRATVPS